MAFLDEKHSTVPGNIIMVQYDRNNLVTNAEFDLHCKNLKVAKVCCSRLHLIYLANFHTYFCVH